VSDHNYFANPIAAETSNQVADQKSAYGFVYAQDPLDVAGENAELEYEQALEKRELDWLKSHPIQ
jgi:hypothetical protein